MRSGVRLALVGLLLSLLGCGAQPTTRGPKDAYAPPPSDDIDMAEASVRARNHLEELITDLESGEHRDHRISILLRDGKRLALFSVRDVRWDGATFAGIAQPPVDDPRFVAPGDDITVRPEDVEDWSYRVADPTVCCFEGVDPVGAYRTRALLARPEMTAGLGRALSGG